jgi:transcription elongation factor GreB
MSKAFTRESDDRPEEQPSPRLSAVLPPGAKNYLTSGGARRLQEELDQLITVERPKASTSPDDSDGRRQLQMLDQRIRHLQQSLQSAVVVPPPAQPWDQVRFGATVTVRNRSGAESNYRIVGIDETDLDRDWVSWLSPIARVLINARLGQRVRFRFPAGEEELEIVRIAYE